MWVHLYHWNAENVAGCYVRTAFGISPSLLSLFLVLSYSLSLPFLFSLLVCVVILLAEPLFATPLL